MTYTSHVVTAVATASALIAFQVIALPQFPEYGTNEEISLFLAMGIVAMGGLVPILTTQKALYLINFISLYLLSIEALRIKYGCGQLLCLLPHKI